MPPHPAYRNLPGYIGETHDLFGVDQQVAGEVVSLKDKAAALGIIAAALVLNGAVVPDVPDRQRGRVLALLRDVGDGDGQPPPSKADCFTVPTTMSTSTTTAT